MDISTVRQKFPQYDDLSDADLAGALHKKFYSDMPFSDFASRIGYNPAPPIPQPSMAAALPQPPSGESVFMGAEDPYYGISQMIGRATGSPIDDAIKLRERVYQKGRGEDPGVDWGRIGGNVGVTAPLSALVPGGIAANVGAGALLGATQPATGDNFAQEKAMQVGLGGAGGGLGAAATKGIGHLLFPGQAQTQLAREGVRLTPGQALGGPVKTIEEKLTAVPLVGDLISQAQGRSIQDFNKMVYNYALEPIGKRFTGNEVGRKGVKFVSDAIDDQYDEILRRIDLSFDNQITDEVSGIIADAQRSMGTKKAKELQEILDDAVFDRLNGDGMLDGNTFKQAQSELRRISRELTARAGKPRDQRLGNAVKQAEESMRAGLGRQHPQYAQALDDVDKAFARYLPINEAAAMQGAKKGVFSPNQYEGRLRMAQKGTNRRRWGTGQVLGQDMSETAREVIGDAFPSSGTAERLAAGGALIGGGLLEPNTLLGAGALGAAYLPGVSTAIGRGIARRPAALEPAAKALMRASPLMGLTGAMSGQEFKR